MYTIPASSTSSEPVAPFAGYRRYVVDETSTASPQQTATTSGAPEGLPASLIGFEARRALAGVYDEWLATSSQSVSGVTLASEWQSRHGFKDETCQALVQLLRPLILHKVDAGTADAQDGVGTETSSSTKPLQQQGAFPVHSTVSSKLQEYMLARLTQSFCGLEAALESLDSGGGGGGGAAAAIAAATGNEDQQHTFEMILTSMNKRLEDMLLAGLSMADMERAHPILNKCEGLVEIVRRKLAARMSINPATALSRSRRANRDCPFTMLVARLNPEAGGGGGSSDSTRLAHQTLWEWTSGCFDHTHLDRRVVPSIAGFGPHPSNFAHVLKFITEAGSPAFKQALYLARPDRLLFVALLQALKDPRGQGGAGKGGDSSGRGSNPSLWQPWNILHLCHSANQECTPCRFSVVNILLLLNRLIGSGETPQENDSSQSRTDFIGGSYASSTGAGAPGRHFCRLADALSTCCYYDLHRPPEIRSSFATFASLPVLEELDPDAISLSNIKRTTTDVLRKISCRLLAPSRVAANLRVAIGIDGYKVKMEGVAASGGPTSGNGSRAASATNQPGITGKHESSIVSSILRVLCKLELDGSRNGISKAGFPSAKGIAAFRDFVTDRLPWMLVSPECQRPLDSKHGTSITGLIDLLTVISSDQFVSRLVSCLLDPILKTGPTALLIDGGSGRRSRQSTDNVLLATLVLALLGPLLLRTIPLNRFLGYHMILTCKQAVVGKPATKSGALGTRMTSGDQSPTFDTQPLAPDPPGVGTGKSVRGNLYRTPTVQPGGGGPTVPNFKTHHHHHPFAVLTTSPLTSPKFKSHSINGTSSQSSPSLSNSTDGGTATSSNTQVPSGVFGKLTSYILSGTPVNLSQDFGAMADCFAYLKAVQLPPSGAKPSGSLDSDAQLSQPSFCPHPIELARNFLRRLQEVQSSEGSDCKTALMELHTTFSKLHAQIRQYNVEELKSSDANFQTAVVSYVSYHLFRQILARLVERLSDPENYFDGRGTGVEDVVVATESRNVLFHFGISECRSARFFCSGTDTVSWRVVHALSASAKLNKTCRAVCRELALQWIADLLRPSTHSDTSITCVWQLITAEHLINLAFEEGPFKLEPDDANKLEIFLEKRYYSRFRANSACSCNSTLLLIYLVLIGTGGTDDLDQNCPVQLELLWKLIDESSPAVAAV